jgi:predicted Fe-S protein YdhL (DUF1289 family)
MQAVVNWSEADQQALKEEVEAIANEEYLAVLFIKQADEFRYGELKTILANAYLNPNSTEYGYPTTLQDALRLLKGYIRIGRNRGHHNNNENKDGVAFVEQTMDWSDKVCFGCGKKGHPVSKCRSLSATEKAAAIEKKEKEWAEKRAPKRPDAEKIGQNHLATDQKVAAEVENIPVVDTGTTQGSTAGSVPSYAEFLEYKQYCEEMSVGFLNVRVGVDRVQEGLDLLGPARKSYRDVLTTGTGTQKTFSRADTQKTSPRSAGRVTLDWWKLYLDSCATYHTAFVDWILDNVHEVDMILKGNCNAGVTTSNEKGWFGTFKMWINKQGIENLLSIP